MKTEFSLARIGQLFLYDWTLERRRLPVMAAIIAGVYLFFALSSFGLSTLTPFWSDSLPGQLWGTAHTVTKYATYAVIIYVTTLLHRKFTQPQTSSLYLTLPASAAEKCVVMLLEYALAYVALWLMMAALYYLTMLVGAIVAPAYDWTLQNFFYHRQSFPNNVLFSMQNTVETFGPHDSKADAAAFAFFVSIVDKINRYSGVILALDWAANIALLLYYILLNMQFSRHPQNKSIVIYLATIAGAVIIFFMVYGFATVSDLQNYSVADHDAVLAVLIDHLGRALDVVIYALFAMPVVCVAECLLFYRQVRTKQAK